MSMVDGMWQDFDAAFKKADEGFAKADKIFRSAPPLMGCICPPTSEQTCQAPACPRKPIGPAA